LVTNYETLSVTLFRDPTAAILNMKAACDPEKSNQNGCNKSILVHFHGIQLGMDAGKHRKITTAGTLRRV
jgi:hypothetical protein